jgi:hypothetical protein
MIFDSALYVTAISSQLFSGLYEASVSSGDGSEPTDERSTIASLSLLHRLLESPIAQSAFWREYNTLKRSSFLPATGHQDQWLSSLARSLRNHNYIEFDKLSHYSTSALPSPSQCAKRSHVLASYAMVRLLDRLRGKARSSSLLILQRAYVDFHIRPETREWLYRHTLMASCCADMSEVLQDVTKVDRLFAQLCEEGQMRRKEDAEPQRWVVNKKFGRA